jgi:hypothetical protein
MIEREFPAAGRYLGTVICPTGGMPTSAIVKNAWVSVRATGGGVANVWFQRSADSDGPAPGAGPAWTGQTFKSATRVHTNLPAGTEWIEYDVTVNGPGALVLELQAL